MSNIYQRTGGKTNENGASMEKSIVARTINHCIFTDSVNIAVIFLCHHRMPDK